MTVHVRVLLLILTGLTGIHSITTVSKVLVKAGDSISIPCLYDARYRNNVKYLCEGYYWTSCSCAVKTNEPSSRKFSISDDKNQRIFTVTIKDVTDKDTDYWCAVEIDGGSDVREYFHLSVTRGTPSLSVDHQEIRAIKGDNITINCYNRNSGEMKWCRLGRSCVTRPSGSIDGTRVTLNATPNVFTVTMSGLRTDSSGWYWCVKEDLQMPVHVTVDEQPTTTTLATTRHVSILSPTSESVNLPPVIADEATTTVQSEQNSSSVDLKSYIIPLSLLIFMVMMSLFIFMMTKQKHTKKESSAKTVRSNTESDVDVLYSSVVTMSQLSVRRVEANDENVIYSTLA